MSIRAVWLDWNMLHRQAKLSDDVDEERRKFDVCTGADLERARGHGPNTVIFAEFTFFLLFIFGYVFKYFCLDSAEMNAFCPVVRLFL